MPNRNTPPDTFNKIGLVIADKIGALLSYWDKDEICRYANNSFIEWFGKSKTEMRGIALKELLGPIYEKNSPHIKGVFAGRTQVFERDLILPDGTRKEYIATYYPDFAEDGSVSGFYVHGADITPIKKLEDGLRASEQKFKLFLENAPDAMVITDSFGIIQLINSQCTRVFGYTRDELIGQAIELLTPEASVIRHIASSQKNVQHAEPKQTDSLFRLNGVRKNGAIFPVDISLSPLETEEGLLIAAAVRDMTETVEKEKEMLQSVEIISDQNKRLINFAHIVSHNLRSHSGNLSRVVDLIAEAESEEERSEMLVYLRQVSEGFTETVNHLNEIVAVQTKKNVEQESVDLYIYIERCLELIAMDIKEANVMVHNNVPRGTTFEYNTAYLESILLNFLTNGIKYRAKDRQPYVDLSIEKIGHELVLHIKDNGIGIDMEKNGARLFGMYSTFNKNQDARGIGLFITRYQVEALGGRIEVQSALGEGTTFSVHFLVKA